MMIDPSSIPRLALRRVTATPYKAIHATRISNGYATARFAGVGACARACVDAAPHRPSLIRFSQGGHLGYRLQNMQPPPNDLRPEQSAAGYKEAARLLAQLADRTRLRILTMLAEGEKNVAEICGRLGRGQPSVSHHLGVLRRSGTVTAKRRGKSVFYMLTRPPGQNEIDVRAGRVTVTIVRATPPPPCSRGAPS
jgi:DNA-binding transcriptional ArsR family regulator